MQKRFAYLNSTGRNGYRTSLDEEILFLCRKDKEITGDLLGSSSVGLEKRGEIFILLVLKSQVKFL